MRGDLRSRLGGALLVVFVACAGLGTACTSGPGDAGGGSAKPSDVPPFTSTRVADPSYKISDIVVRTAAVVSAPTSRSRTDAMPRPASNFLMHVASGSIEVTLHVPHALTPAERTALEQVGARVGEVAIAPDHSARVDAWIPAGALMGMAGLDFVAAITPPGYAAVNQVTPQVISEGVATHRADVAHAHGVTGKGVIVGVTSSGTQTLTLDSLALSQARRELPQSCPLTVGPNAKCVFGGDTPCVCDIGAGNGHEGTAMLEIVHDVAPGADLLFLASSGVAGHVNALNGLAAAGANVITEDLAFDGEPAFQRGFAAAAADNIAMNGVPVHATAGNLGNSHTARVVAAGTGLGPDGVQFAKAPSNCTFSPDNVVAIAPNGDTTFDAIWSDGGAGVVLQWSEPRAIFPTVGQGGFTDLNLYVMDESLTKCFLQSTAPQANGQGDTIEFVGDAPAPLNVIPRNTHVKIVVDVQGTSSAVTPPTLDLRFRGITPVDRTTAAGSLDPDSNYTSNLVANVGASNDGRRLNGFSGQGPETLGLTTVCPGNGLGPCTGVMGPGLTTLQGIFWTARDTVSISGVGPFGGGTCPSPAAMPQGQCFFGGTSASAPHSAGCDALIRQLFGASLSPLASNARLIATADPSLVDDNTRAVALPTAEGAGLLDCYAALGPPHMACAPETVLVVDDTCRAALDPLVLAAGSFDPEGGFLSFTTNPSGPLFPGDATVEVTGKDRDGLTASCPTLVHVVDATAPRFGALPAQVCVLARQPFVVQAPTVSDNCQATLAGTILADAAIPTPLTVSGGQTVTLPVGAHRISWQAADAGQRVALAETIVVTDPPLRRLANGDMLYTVTLPGRQAYVEAFVQQNGVQNVAGGIANSGVANGDGTFTYSRTVPANRYHAGDVIKVRFYSYQAGKPGLFTPGPAEQIWFPELIYGQEAACPTAAPAGCLTTKLTPVGAAASSQESSTLGAARAIDGSFSTRWSSAFSDPQSLTVDLGERRFVNRVVLFWEAAASAKYQLQISDDAAKWTTVFTETKGNGFTDEIAGLNVQARYLRMLSTARTTSFGDSLFEVQVFGDPNPACR